MSEVLYTVACSFEKEEIAEGWLDWLRREHLQDVCDGGAVRATIVKMESPELRYEIRYTFPSRKVFDAYLENHAPRLREEGLRLFPLELGLAYDRSVGEALHAHRPSGD